MDLDFAFLLARRCEIIAPRAYRKLHSAAFSRTLLHSDRVFLRGLGFFFLECRGFQRRSRRTAFSVGTAGKRVNRIAEGIVSRGTQVGLRRWHEDSGQIGRLLRLASRVASQVGVAVIVLPCARIISEQPAADAEPHGSFRNGQQGAGAAPARQHRTGDQTSFTLFASSLQGFVRAADARPSVCNSGQK